MSLRSQSQSGPNPIESLAVSPTGFTECSVLNLIVTISKDNIYSTPHLREMKSQPTAKAGATVYVEYDEYESRGPITIKTPVSRQMKDEHIPRHQNQ